MGAPSTGESDQSAWAMASWFDGTSSHSDRKDAKVPPGTPPRNVAAVVLVPSGAWPSVLEARWTIASDGTESTPQEGTMMERVLVASQSYLYFYQFFFLGGPPSFVSYGRTWGMGLGEKKKHASLFDYVEDPRRLSGYIDVVYAVPCARAGVYAYRHQFRLRYGDRLRCDHCNGHDIPHDWSPIVPEGADAIEHDLGLLDDTLDGLLVENVDVE